MPILVDTGILYALADVDDSWHLRARSWLEQTSDMLLTPVTVLPEAAYLIRSRLGPLAEARLLESLVRRELAIENLASSDLERTAEVLDRYGDLGFVDATVVAMAERLGISTIATTDRRHFSQVRPRPSVLRAGPRIGFSRLAGSWTTNGLLSGIDS